jgi:hypothetical protein
MHRRRLLVGLVAVVAAACGVRREPGPQATPDASPETSPGRPGPASPEPEPSPEPEEPEPAAALPPAPDPAAPYEPVAAETHPNAKALGAAVAQALTTYDPDERLEDIVARASDDRADRGDLEAARPLHHPGWSRGEVLYPQFGGLTEDRCSIMVVVRQELGRPDGTIRVEVRTIDVRLRIRRGDWVFDALASAGGEPVERPDDLPDEASLVLDDDRIELPDSARWDIHRGATSPELLGLMHRFAEETGGYAVCVLESGHPINVFGTDRLSDHMRGRAVDIHRVADRLVIDDRDEGSATDRAVEWLYDEPAEPIVGSPWALDEFGGRSFTDAVHQDHLHVAVRRPSDEGEPPDEELAS